MKYVEYVLMNLFLNFNIYQGDFFFLRWLMKHNIIIIILSSWGSYRNLCWYFSLCTLTFLHICSNLWTKIKPVNKWKKNKEINEWYFLLLSSRKTLNVKKKDKKIPHLQPLYKPGPVGLLFIVTLFLNFVSGLLMIMIIIMINKKR